MSLVLTGSEVMQVLDMDLALAAAREAFRAYGEGRVNMPPKAYLTLAQGDFRAMYGEIFLPEGHVCGLKWVNVHPGNPLKGLPTVMAFGLIAQTMATGPVNNLRFVVRTATPDAVRSPKAYSINWCSTMLV